MDETLKYPAGKVHYPPGYEPNAIASCIQEIESLPGDVKNTVLRLSEEQLNTKTMPGVWSVRQVIHHTVDSHINAFTRFKLALTEESPVIKPYDEGKWAQLPDSLNAPVELSVALLEALHKRWVFLLRAMNAEDFSRAFHHPDSGKNIPLWQAVSIYAWHGRHHLAHVKLLLEKKGW